MSVLWELAQVPVPPLPTELSTVSMLQFARDYISEVVEAKEHTLDLLKVLNGHQTDDVKFGAAQLAAKAAESVRKAEQWLAERSWWPRTGPKPAPADLKYPSNTESSNEDQRTKSVAEVAESPAPQ